MNQRLSPAKLQRLACALTRLISAVHDARVRYVSCKGLRPTHLAGLSLFLREMLQLSHDRDYRPFERQLKRRLIRSRHRAFGWPPGSGKLDFHLRSQLPVVYGDALDAFDAQSKAILRALADVDLTNGPEPLQSVAQIVWAVDGATPAIRQAILVAARERYGDEATVSEGYAFDGVTVRVGVSPDGGNTSFGASYHFKKDKFL